MQGKSEQNTDCKDPEDFYDQLKQAVIAPAYNNMQQWHHDAVAYPGLKTGVYVAEEAFDEIEATHLNSKVYLKQMLKMTEKLLKRYGQLPGSQGEWESSALGIIKNTIIQIKKNGFQ
ncbi:hypothetical protein [Glaciecola sp. 1036]|uniref:hypothetical protein n=1 Tax=Alteromonadaceae TaxID=72275 RepID=UPI003CFFCB69